MGNNAMDRMREQCKRLGVEIVQEDVSKVDLNRRPFVVETTEGRAAQAEAEARFAIERGRERDPTAHFRQGLGERRSRGLKAGGERGEGFDVVAEALGDSDPISGGAVEGELQGAEEAGGLQPLAGLDAVGVGDAVVLCEFEGVTVGLFGAELHALFPGQLLHDAVEAVANTHRQGRWGVSGSGRSCHGCGRRSSPARGFPRLGR